MNTTIFYVFLFIHLISLITGFGAVIIIDTFGLLWLIRKFGVDLTLVRRVAHVTQTMIWLGFAGLVLSGVPMLIMKGDVDNLTKIKIFFVIMVGLNGIFLHFIKKGLDSLGENIDNVPARYFFRISLASAISQLGWWGATAIGFYHRHIDHDIPWPRNYGILIGLVVAMIAIAAYLGETVTRKRG